MKWEVGLLAILLHSAASAPAQLSEVRCKPGWIPSQDGRRCVLFHRVDHPEARVALDHCRMESTPTAIPYVDPGAASGSEAVWLGQQLHRHSASHPGQTLFFVGLERPNKTAPFQWMNGNTNVPFRQCTLMDCEWDHQCQLAVHTPGERGVVFQSFHDGEFCIYWADLGFSSINFYARDQLAVCEYLIGTETKEAETICDAGWHLSFDGQRCYSFQRQSNRSWEDTLCDACKQNEEYIVLPNRLYEWYVKPLIARHSHNPDPRFKCDNLPTYIGATKLPLGRQTKPSQHFHWIDLQAFVLDSLVNRDDQCSSVDGSCLAAKIVNDCGSDTLPAGYNLIYCAEPCTDPRDDPNHTFIAGLQYYTDKKKSCEQCQHTICKV